ncbi:MAG: hypothetical protein JO025_10110 [Verrucomicrobia bacterium]|nr:hypothetical protein [Verrucomicrobiota bacterium]
MCFDVLWYKGDGLIGKPILERRGVLERILKSAAGIQLGSYVEEEGKALFQLNQRKRDGGNYRQAQGQPLPAR